MDVMIVYTALLCIVSLYKLQMLQNKQTDLRRTWTVYKLPWGIHSVMFIAISDSNAQISTKFIT